MAKLKSLFAQAPTELKVFEEPTREALSYSDLDNPPAHINGQRWDDLSPEDQALVLAGHLDGHIGNYNDGPHIDYDKIAEELSIQRGGPVSRKEAKETVYQLIYSGPNTGSPTLDDFLKTHYNPLGVTHVVYPGLAVPVVIGMVIAVVLALYMLV